MSVASTLVQQRSVTRIVWVLSGFVVFGIGVGRIWWPSSQQISQVGVRAQDEYEEANRIDVQLRHARQLRVIQTRVEGDIARLSLRASSAAATSRELALFNEESERFGVDVRTIVPQPATKNDPEDVLVETNLELGLRGSFRSLVTMLADLTRHDVLIGVRDIAISAAGATPARPSPTLDVTIHAAMYRLRSPARMEVPPVPRALR